MLHDVACDYVFDAFVNSCCALNTCVSQEAGRDDKTDQRRHRWQDLKGFEGFEGQRSKSHLGEASEVIKKGTYEARAEAAAQWRPANCFPRYGVCEGQNRFLVASEQCRQVHTLSRILLFRFARSN